MEAQAKSGNDSPLTAEQWAGLARLGDFGNKLGALTDGPLAGAATAVIDRFGELDGRYDLATLAEKLVATVATLERAGLLDLVRENAQFIADSLEVLTPMLDDWLGRIKELPASEFKADAEFVLALLRKTRVIAGFVEDKLAGELTGKTAALTEFMQRNDTDQAVAEALVQLGRLYRCGLLARLGDLAEYVAGLEEGTDFESLVGNLVESLPKNAIGQAIDVMHSAEDAMEDARKDEQHLGGYAGMLHLLRDEEVQKGLRMLSVLPIYLEKRMEKHD
ncbi:hypothetical protein [Acidihalobacter ferrooxydans]|uniref:DUF1641 domain-containing protein n=1 Tax=Acidihalobacter ferrooxydans TaxID=1765967 RepID=A0A1P8UIB7_9GAMM|nr:hypothetical protein [Acidihalobacter ferrooxydans]APZ43576.1 hypothetical protein BW247_11150 [Acidihalobacter ferrooxydans]